MLGRLQADLGFEFVVVSRPKRALPSGRLRWQFVEWSPEIETRIAALFDVGIMPLLDEPFQRSKCGCKLLQYMAAGLPWRRLSASIPGCSGESGGSSRRRRASGATRSRV